MRKIKSFTVDHMTLLPGIYVSRDDRISQNDAFDPIGNAPIPHNGIADSQLYPVTTYDIRMTRPNFEPVMSTGEIHAIEHLGATFLRNRPELKYKVIYWGPMGCRTGFYLILAGKPDIPAVIKLMADTFEFIAAFEGKIPGATPEECGNFSDMDLSAANQRAENYLKLIKSL